MTPKIKLTAEECDVIFGLSDLFVLLQLSLNPVRLDYIIAKALKRSYSGEGDG